jgi:hypothetical protein
MSESLVNQLTLNYLISKQQLSKLNKKIKEDRDQERISDKDNYKHELLDLFTKLLNGEQIDVSEEIKYAFNYFVDKSSYYFKMTKNLEKPKDIVVTKCPSDELDNRSDKETNKIYDNFNSNSENDTNNNSENYTNNNSENDSNSDYSEEEQYDLEEENINYINNDDNTKKIMPLKTSEFIENIQPVRRFTKSKPVNNIDDLPNNIFFQKVKSDKIIPRSKK